MPHASLPFHQNVGIKTSSIEQTANAFQLLVVYTSSKSLPPSLPPPSPFRPLLTESPPPIIRSQL